jgi:uncharacterized membrane protein
LNKEDVVLRIKAHHILYAVNILTVILFALIALLPSNVLRIIIGLPVVLFFPGYTLIAALFPRKGSLSGIERLALSFGLSIAVVPLIGLVLNYLPWGIRLYPILISLFVFVFVMSVIAWYRGRKLVPEEQVTLQLNFKLPSLAVSWSSQSRWGKILTIVLGVMVIGAIGTLWYVVSLPRIPEKFTEFYVLNSEGKAENYPRTIILGQSGEVILGIINHEHETTEYRIEISIDGVNKGEIGDISLNAEEKWEQAVTFTPDQKSANQKIEFQLYKGAALDSYETLHLWIDVE